jgi:hypothetical protein
MAPEERQGRPSYVPDELRDLIREHLALTNWDYVRAFVLWPERVRNEPGFAHRVAEIAQRLNMQLTADSSKTGTNSYMSTGREVTQNRGMRILIRDSPPR